MKLFNFLQVFFSNIEKRMFLTFLAICWLCVYFIIEICIYSQYLRNLIYKEIAGEETVIILGSHTLEHLQHSPM